MQKLTPQNAAALVVVAGLIIGALFLVSAVGWLATVVVAAIVLAVACHVIPRGLVAVLAQVFALELILPHLGLIEFHGGFWSAVVAVIALIIGIICTNFLFNITGLMDAMNRAIETANHSTVVRALVTHWLAWAAVLSVALWVAAGIDDDIVLLGFVPTVAAGLVLSGIRESFHIAGLVAKAKSKSATETEASDSKSE